MYLKYDGKEIKVNEVSSKATVNLRAELKQALEYFARYKSSSLNLTDEKLIGMIEALTNDKKVFVNVGGLDYDLSEIILAYITKYPSMDFKPDMEQVSNFVNEEIVPLLDVINGEMLFNYLYGYIALVYLPKLHLLMLAGEDITELNNRFSPAIEIVISYILRKIQENRSDDKNE